MKLSSSIHNWWRWMRWPLAVLALAYISLVIYRTLYLIEKDKTDAAVAAIHANRLTHEDVFGDLPPEPDKALNDSTVAGIDTNANGIRDDVERSIYFAHKDSTKVSAAMLQYAKALNNQLLESVNSETLVATTQEVSRGFFCIGDVSSGSNVFDSRIAEVEGLVLNTDLRKQRREEVYKYAISHGDIGGPDCDLDPTSFQG